MWHITNDPSVWVNYVLFYLCDVHTESRPHITSVLVFFYGSHQTVQDCVGRRLWQLANGKVTPSGRSIQNTSTTHTSHLKIYLLGLVESVNDIHQDKNAKDACLFVSEVTYIQYIARNMHTVFCRALLFYGHVMVHNEFTWSINPYSSGLLCWHWGNRYIAKVPVK